MMFRRGGATRMRSLVAGLATAALAACGGGGGGGDTPAPSAATLQAGPDSATLAWNAAATIDVLANDSASRGALVLHGVTAGAHGQAEIVGSQLRYTPSAGFIGTDTFSYTVRAAEGGTLATASVAVTVEARMTLTGIATAAPLAAAQLRASVGGTEFSGTTDAQGRYALEVRSSRPADFVTLTATGTGAQASVKLTSLVGDIASLAARAQDSVVSAANVPALNLTPVSSAIAALASRRGAGSVPASSAALNDVLLAVLPDEVVHLASVVRLVAHGTAPLPAGSADTLALLQDETALNAFVQLHAVQINQSAYQAARVELLSELPMSAGDLPAVAGPQTVAYLGSDDLALLVTYRGDGSATVHGSYLARGRYHFVREASWQREAGRIVLTLATPYSFQVAESEGIGAASITGIVLRQATGGLSGGLALMSLVGSAVVTEGPDAGTPIAAYAGLFDGTPHALLTQVDLDRRLPIGDEEVAPGRRFGGVLTHVPGSDTSPGEADAIGVLRFGATGAATLEGWGQSVTWQLADRWLSVPYAGATVRYARLGKDDITGDERWIAIAHDGTGDRWMWPLRILAADPQPAFTAASAARVWSSTLGALVEPRQHPMQLFDDGTVLRATSPGTWSVDAGGALHMTFPDYLNRPHMVMTRDWTPLKRRGDRVWVLQRTLLSNLFGGSYPFGGVFPFTDGGPAVK